MAQTGGRNSLYGMRGLRVVNHAPPKRVPPQRSPIYGGLGNAAAPIIHAQRQAHQRVQRAQAPILKRTSVPYVPKLAHPTPAQRSAAVQIVGQGLKRQGVTTPEVKALAHGQGSRTQQQRVNRYLGGYQTQQRRVSANVAAQTGAQGTQRELARVGRSISSSLRAQATPYADQHTRVGFPGATIDLTSASNALGAKLAGNPLSAFVKGVNVLATTHPFSDKGVLGRTANDLLTYPAAAIPTAYQAVTNPGQLASGIAQQVTHPVQTLKEHPLFGAMLLHGGVSAVGRTGGALSRAAGSDFAATARPSLGLAGESGANVQLARSYSKDLVRKAGQVALDRTRTPVRDVHGNPILDERGRQVLAARPREARRLQNQRADFLASRANAVERNTRAQASRDVLAAQPVREHGGGRVRQAVGGAVDRSLMAQPTGRARVLPKGFYRPEKDVVTMAMEGTLRSPETFKQDLLKERQRLETSYQAQDLNPLEKRTNRSRLRTVDRVLNDPKALRNAGNVFTSAKALSARANVLSQEAIDAGLLHPEAAARAKLFPYAQSHMGAQVVEHSDGTHTLRAGDGTFLSNQQITAHMAQNGVNPAQVSYLPHRFDVRGARAFHQQFQLRRPNLDQESRTGSAYAKGATDTGLNLALEHMVRQGGTLARQQEFDRLIGEVGIKHPSGRYFTWKEAQQYAKRAGRAPNEATNQLLPGEPDLVPVRAVPAKYDEARAQAIQNEQGASVPGASHNLIEQMTDRFRGAEPSDPNAPNVVLVPRQIADRLQENLRGSGAKSKGLQAASNLFRSTVLPFSTKWLTGNIAEGVLRLTVAGVSPHDPHVFRKLLAELDPVTAKQVDAHLRGGLLYGEKGLTNRRTAADVSQTAGTIARAPVARELGKTLGALTKPSFITNTAFEHSLQEAALGKWTRQQIQEFTGSWLKAVTAQKASLKEVAKGLADTKNQHAAAKYLDETLGQYSRFSPGMRHVIQTYAPFLPWYVNSMRFVFHTLPFKHPVKTAVLTQAEAAFQKDWQDQHKGIPASLKTAIPSKGGFIDATRYTPFGGPGPLAVGDFGSLPGIVLPQVSGPLLALRGLDPFGKPLKVPKTGSNPQGVAQGAQPAVAAANQLAESFIPGLAIARRIREGGRTAYGNSTLLSPKTQEPKAGAHQVSAANRILNPLRPVYVSPGRASGGGGQLSPAQQAVLKAYQRTQGSATQSGLTPAQEAVLRAYRRSHG